MAQETIQCVKRQTAPLSTRIDLAVVVRVQEICDATGLERSTVVGRLLTYALGHVKLVDVTRKEITFPEAEATPEA